LVAPWSQLRGHGTDFAGHARHRDTAPVEELEPRRTLGMTDGPCRSVTSEHLPVVMAPKLLDTPSNASENRVTPCPVPPARRRVRTAGDGPNACYREHLAAP
jgi:hypothetical protein